MCLKSDNISLWNQFHCNGFPMSVITRIKNYNEAGQMAENFIWVILRKRVIKMWFFDGILKRKYNCTY